MSDFLYKNNVIIIHNKISNNSLIPNNIKHIINFPRFLKNSFVPFGLSESRSPKFPHIVDTCVEHLRLYMSFNMNLFNMKQFSLIFLSHRFVSEKKKNNFWSGPILTFPSLILIIIIIFLFHSV